MLTITNLCKSYGGKQQNPVLHDINLRLVRGEYIAIMGESGVGKSTLLNLIAGLDVPDSGKVVLDGADLADLDDTARTHLRRRCVGFVFQAFHLLPHLTISQNVALPLVLCGASSDQQKQRTSEILDAVGLAKVARNYPRQLSGGEMQRAAIARALVHRPQLVLADEPTGNLDSDNARHVLGLLAEQIARNSGSGILVTHSAAAAATAQRTYVLTGSGLQPPART